MFIIIAVLQLKLQHCHSNSRIARRDNSREDSDPPQQPNWKWTDKISNTTLWKMTKQLPLENEIKKRKWRWIGHTLRKPPNTSQAITWNPPGKRRRIRPRNTWQRDTEEETKEMGYTRGEMEKMATDRKRWRSLVDGLCSQRANRHK